MSLTIEGVVGGVVSGVVAGEADATRPRMALWQAAKTAVAAGTRNAKLLCLGNSTTMGYGALSTSITANDVTASYPTVLASLLTAGSSQSFFGTHANGTAGSKTFDTRLSVPTGWTAGTGLQAVGAQPWWGQSPAVASIDFTPLTSVTSFDIYYSEYSGGGILGWAIDGGAVTNIDTNNAVTSVKKITVSAGAAGTHTLNIWWVSGALVVYNAAVGYNSAVKEVTVMNGGWSGGTAANLAQSAAGSSLEMLGLIAPDLTILDATINDWQAATSVSAYAASMQSIITKAKLSGDVLLVSGNPSDVSIASVAQQQLYIDSCQSLARTNRLPFLNLTQRWVNYTTANAAGKMRDTRHPKDVGYADIAAAIFGYL